MGKNRPMPRGRVCRVRGCGKIAHGAGVYCDKHWTARKRHGDAEQIGVLSGELTPIKAHLKKWIKSRKNADDIWRGVRDAWRQCREKALAEMRTIEGGTNVGIAWKMAALRDVIIVGGDADEDQIILTVMAVAYLRADNPKRFMSDRAVLFQIARRFRTLSDVNVGEFYNHKTGLMHRVYRTPAPRHAQLLGQMLMEAIGVHGLAIHNKEGTERAKVQAQRQAALTAIAGVN